MRKFYSRVLVLCALAAWVAPAGAQSTVIQIDADNVVGKVSPKLYGLMTEEINYSYDGGLYAELIQNRIFQDSPGGGRGNRGAPATEPAPVEAPTAPVIPHWSVILSPGAQGSISKDAKSRVNTVALKTSLKLDITSVSAGQRVGIANDGYWGIPVKPDTTYRASFYAKAGSSFKGALTVAIESNDGATVFAKADVAQVTSDWKKYEVTLKTGKVAPSATNRFVISAASPGTVWFNLVSLFPPTFNNRPNGNRIDIMEKLVAMKPQFLRFPGGNYLEGNDLANRYDFKITLHDLSQRPGHLSPWRYRSSDGMGLLEFLEWAEDTHAEPLLAVFAGFTLRGTFVAKGDDLKPFVQDALDEIEYVIGDKSTKWGAERIADGHPEPFKLSYIEVGNEDNLGGGGATYDERFAAFYDAIKAKYPQLQVIATTNVRGRVPDVVDEHSYMQADAALRSAHRFDNRPRTGTPKVFMGEWATRIGSPTTNLQAGLCDAAFMTGLERNSDIVVMSCYAPLFVNVNPGGMQWPSDLIGYDALTSYGCPSYYVQKMFAEYLGDTLPKLTMTGVPTRQSIPAGRGRGRGAATNPTTAPAPPPIEIEQVYSSVTRDSAKGTIYLKMVNVSETPQPVLININGAGSLADQAKCVVITSANQADTNSITEPTRIVPTESKISGVGPSFNHTLPPYSIMMLQIDKR